MPPQHGKSELISHWFAAWLLGNWPDRRVILCSYESEFAAQWGDKVRRTLEAWGQSVFGLNIDSRSNAKDRWRIEGRRGGMDCVGIKGAATGKAADIVIVDDPIKNPEEASSETIRGKHKRWFGGVVETRLSKHGAAIVVMTRWHEDDLAGWLYAQHLQQIGEKVEFLVLPALAVDPQDLPEGAAEYYGVDPLARAPGEALCPELHPVEKLEKLRERDEMEFWGLCQQYPHSPKGNVFSRDHFMRWTPSKCPLEIEEKQGCYRVKEGREPFDQVVQSWDFTYGSLTGRSWCVGQVWGSVGADYWLLYQVRAKLTFDQMLEEVEAVTDLFPMAAAKLIEAKAAGPHVIKRLRKRISGLLPIPVVGSKIARAHSCQPIVKAGNVWIPDENGFPWVKDFLKEVTSFPLSTTDDQVDTMSQAINFLEGQSFRFRRRKPKGL